MGDGREWQSSLRPYPLADREAMPACLLYPSLLPTLELLLRRIPPSAPATSGSFLCFQLGGGGPLPDRSPLNGR